MRRADLGIKFVEGDGWRGGEDLLESFGNCRWGREWMDKFWKNGRFRKKVGEGKVGDVHFGKFCCDGVDQWKFIGDDCWYAK